MPENSFDVASKIDLQEVNNAIQQTLKEVHTRFDLKTAKCRLEWNPKERQVLLGAEDEFKLKAMNEVFQQKLVRRGVPLKGLTYGKAEP